MHFKNLVSINDLTKSEILETFDLADFSSELFALYNNPLSQKVLGTFFFQSSTRTQFSFQSAFAKLGGTFIGCNDVNSIRCGHPYYETMDDFAKIVSNYCDVIVMRSRDESEMQLFINNSTVPVISAGCGRLEHPTQALIDLYSIKKFFGCIDNNKILIIGTPNQRTIHSLLLGLDLWSNIEVFILCQEGQSIRPEIKSRLNNINIKIYTSWNALFDSDILSTISIIYVGEIYYDNLITTNYLLTKKILDEYFSKEVIILSPLPRTNELTREVDNFNGAKYFHQAQMGMYIRASIFLKCFHIT